jgi:fatty acid desaturase
MPDQVTAQLVAELLGIGALAVAILWQPAHRCRWQHCPHHGKRALDELRLEREQQDREPPRGGPRGLP